MDKIFSVKAKQAKVFHDGTSMIVMNRGQTVKVAERFIPGLVAEGVIDAPKGFSETEATTIAKADGGTQVDAGGSLTTGQGSAPA